MIKILVFAVTAASLLAAPVYAQSVGEKTGVNAVIGIAPKTEDFVKIAAISDMFEIESSKLPASNAQDPAIKSFAEKMVKDHTQVSTELKALVSASKIRADVPMEMDAAHKGKIDRLQRLKGADFDKQYDSDQETAHKDAVSLFERYSEGGDNPEFKAFAVKHLPHLQEHLKMIQAIKK